MKAQFQTDNEESHGASWSASPDEIIASVCGWNIMLNVFLNWAKTRS